ncbi:MAG: response regulator transcription factor [Candidatus Omnitrophica bacterium]|nr:response regulator transcription factor [Candidatus Omnitrophota bacterium]
MTSKILLIEDDQDIAHLLELHLTDSHYEISHVDDGKAGLKEALSNGYDLIILDLVLPQIDGMQLCHRIRSADVKTPVLMLTSKSSINDRVKGLEIGADDYLTKPFSIRELKARVKALLRRQEITDKKNVVPKFEVIEFPGLVIDIVKRKIQVDGKNIELTQKEFDLLVQFARYPGRIYTRNELLDLVWGYHYQGYEHTVNSHINRLRGKIEENPSDPKYILTIHKLGYKFFDEDDR